MRLNLPYTPTSRTATGGSPPAGKSSGGSSITCCRPPNRCERRPTPTRSKAHSVAATRARRPLVIDVGCGTGGNIGSLADAYRCVGIDTSEDAIQWARQRFPNVQFIEGRAPDDLGELAREASFITLMDVLEHVSDDFQLLSSLLAPLTPGTYVLVTVPAELALWSPHDESFGHYRRYDSARLRAVWEGLPVETLLFSHYNARLYRVIKTIRTMTRWLHHGAGEHGTDFSMPPAPLNWLLEKYFAGEGEALCEALDKTDEGYGRGVSLIALLAP